MSNSVLPALNIFNTLRPRQNGRHFPDNIFKCIFLFVNVWSWIKISLKFVPKVRINNIPVLIQIMAWRRIGDKPLSEPIMVNLVTHICVTRPQWVKRGLGGHNIPDLEFPLLRYYGLTADLYFTRELPYPERRSLYWDRTQTGIQKGASHSSYNGK